MHLPILLVQRDIHCCVPFSTLSADPRGDSVTGWNPETFHYISKRTLLVTNEYKQEYNITSPNG